MALLRIATVFLLMCLAEVWSLKCYSCFSYISHNDCENRYNLKEIECDSQHDTCVKFSMTVDINERHGDKNIVKTNKAYARYCGVKTECENDVAAICQRMYYRNVAKISDCLVQCCNADLKAECNKRPGWPGTQVSSAIITHNNTRDNKIYKIRGSTGVRLTYTIWSLLLVCLSALV